MGSVGLDATARVLCGQHRAQDNIVEHFVKRERSRGHQRGLGQAAGQEQR